MDRPPAPAAWADVRGKATNCVRTPGPGPPDGAWGPRVHQDTLCPPRHIFITSKCQDLAPPSSELASHCPPVGEPPLPWLVTEGWARGGGFPLYILCHTNPQVLILAGFVFILIFFFFGFDFFNKNFHFKHIYTEGICAVYWGELDPELEWGGSWGRGNGSEGAPTLSMSPCPLSPPPQPLPPQFSL